jgi:hypothetical protein
MTKQDVPLVVQVVPLVGLVGFVMSVAVTVEVVIGDPPSKPLDHCTFTWAFLGAAEADNGASGTVDGVTPLDAALKGP